MLDMMNNEFVQKMNDEGWETLMGTTTVETKGLRRKVRDGDITVKEAQEWLDKQGCPDYFPIRKWLKQRKQK